MRKLLYIFFFLVSIGSFAQSEETDVVSNPEVAPVPPYGSYKDYYRYITKNLQLTEEAYKNRVSAEVIVRFIVYTDGAPGLFKIVGTIPECPSCSKSAMSLIKSCPQKWKPAMQRGKPVKTWVEVPIRFDAK
ncbi:MAG: energy transducer TonB [Bacteroidia bacterium]